MVDYATAAPPELWASIFNLLADPHEFVDAMNRFEGRRHHIVWNTECIRQLCLVSRAFFAIADPFRWEDVRLEIKTMDVQWQLPLINDFLDFLESRPQTLPWIRDLTLGRPKPNNWAGTTVEGGHIASYTSLEPRLHQAVLGMSNLRKLALSYTSIPQSLFCEIASMPKLTTLQFGPIDITPEASSVSRVAYRPALPLGHLFVHGNIASAASQEMIVQLLERRSTESLTLWPPLSEESPGNIPLLSLLTQALAVAAYSSLRALTIRVPLDEAELQQFIQLGTQCPSLSFLHLETIKESKRVVDQLIVQGLTPRHFSKLETFWGPLPLAVLFAEGRPLHTVQMIYQGAVFRYEAAPDPIAQDVMALRSAVGLRTLGSTLR